MRIWGTVLLVLGALFVIMFAFAQFGGAHLGILPFFVSFFLLLMGWNLRKSGKGILQPKPVAEHAGAETLAASVQPVTPAAEFSTVEMPLTPGIAEIIARQSARAKRILLYVVGGCVVLFGGIGIVIGATDKTPGEGMTFFAVFGSIGVASAGLIYGITWLTSLRLVRRDLRGTTYLRTTGPVEVVSLGNGAMLRLADRAFLIDQRYGATELRALGWGRVDYSPHGHVILGAWDRDGRSVYSLPGYNAT
jgi:hypothetical protein